MKIFLGIVLCFCLVHGACGFMARIFGPNGILGRRGQQRTPGTGPSAICSTDKCLPYTVIEKTAAYERRRYEGITLVVTENSPGWMSNMKTFSNLRGYFRGEGNSQGVRMNLTYPVIKLFNGSSPALTMIALPSDNSSTPPTPTTPSLEIAVLPAMEVLAKSHRIRMFGSHPAEAILEFRTSLGPSVTLVSDAAFIAEYTSGFKFFGREGEIWLIADYPNNPNAPRMPAVDPDLYQPSEPVEPTEAAEI